MRSGRRLVIVVALAALGMSGMAGASATTAKPSAVANVAVHYAVDEPVCAQPADPAAIRCFALKRVKVAKGTPGARAYSVPNAVGLGPAGGYTPDDLAAAYGYNADKPSSTQVVGIVDWYDDPDALKDLNTFDTTYGLPKETATSFRKVNQKGLTTPLPKADHATSGEIALDVESVRGVCHTCRILLVEATSPTDSDIALAENRAVTMGAKEISNSFGEPEKKVAASVLAAYNHPGVVITASTGDNGWYGWDKANNPSGSSDSAAEFPSTDPDVIAVGGTTLELNGSGARAAEFVWNEDGTDDQNGLNQGKAQGAGGGGCSKLYAAQPWQAHYAGYTAAGCSGKRLAADISAIADPQTGFDILDSYATDPGWGTYGGTSLASPVTAALFALAGGSGGATYPASSLYTNGVHSASSLFDVVSGGNGFCAGDTTTSCGNSVFNNFDGGTHNPNALGAGNVDCSFPRDETDPASAPPSSSECNAVAGYDGASGLGTPTNGTGLYVHTNPSVTLTRPTSMRLKKAGTFSAKAVEPLAGITVTKYVWSWGDGHTTTTTAASTPHIYGRAGAYAITLTVTDSSYQVMIKKTSIIVGKKASVHLTGPTKLKVKKTGSFSTHGTTDPNTGAKISKVSWRWGDGKSSTGPSAKHAYTKKGTHTITIVITDTTGVVTTVTRKVTVS